MALSFTRIKRVLGFKDSSNSSEQPTSKLRELKPRVGYNDRGKIAASKSVDSIDQIHQRAKILDQMHDMHTRHSKEAIAMRLRVAGSPENSDLHDHLGRYADVSKKAGKRIGRERKLVQDQVELSNDFSVGETLGRGGDLKSRTKKNLEPLGRPIYNHTYIQGGTAKPKDV